ncbi:MAG: undecaprenyl-phosphate glucose phosphotransferase, partial [Lachnospiraceae bacterium]|nr:undecaprenyl-phosphate glucose phosphotransferase [Lachnospiraceae bacterium]
MIRDNQKGLNRLHILVDAVVVAVSYLLAWYIKFVILNKDTTIGILSRETYFSALYYIIPGYLSLFYYCDLYSSRRYSSVEREIF